MSSLVAAVREVRSEVDEFGDRLSSLRPLLVLLEGLAAQFDDGELPAVAVQQLRQGLNDVRLAVDEAREGRASGSVVLQLLEQARNEVRRSGEPQ